MNAMSQTAVIEPAPPASMERHYSVAEVAAQWGLSEDTVRRLFEHEPGVLMIEPPRGQMSRRRRYRTLRIPESVLDRVHRMHLIVKGGR